MNGGFYDLKQKLSLPLLFSLNDSEADGLSPSGTGETAKAPGRRPPADSPAAALFSGQF